MISTTESPVTSLNFFRESGIGRPQPSIHRPQPLMHRPQPLMLPLRITVPPCGQSCIPSCQRLVVFRRFRSIVRACQRVFQTRGDKNVFLRGRLGGGLYARELWVLRAFAFCRNLCSVPLMFSQRRAFWGFSFSNFASCPVPCFPLFPSFLRFLYFLFFIFLFLSSVLFRSFVFTYIE